MPFVVNRKYSKDDPISVEAWRESILGLVGDNVKLRCELVSYLIDEKKDAKAKKLADEFGRESLSASLDSFKDFIDKFYCGGSSNHVSNQSNV